MRIFIDDVFLLYFENTQNFLHDGIGVVVVVRVKKSTKSIDKIRLYFVFRNIRLFAGSVQFFEEFTA